MKELGFAEDRIEEILADYYHIKSPERIAAEEAAAHRYAEEQEERLNDPDYLESQLSGQIEIIEKEKKLNQLLIISQILKTLNDKLNTFKKKKQLIN